MRVSRDYRGVCRLEVVDVTERAGQVGLAQVLSGIAPWLVELGNWIFGALIGFNLVILGAVLTIVPVDSAVKVATAAAALALPPGAVGLVVLRLVADVRSIRTSDAAAQALRDAGLHVQDAAEQARRRNTLILRYTYGFMTLTVLLTLIGLTAALWHSAWWIGVAFLVMLVVSVALLLVAASQIGGGGRRRGPTGAAEPPQGG